jgi:pimeloyl-ACP methyl ester carboxylesterase
MACAKPRCELVRMRTADCLELHGMLFEPERKAGLAIVHVHGWVGNFYENRFLEPIAKEAVKKGVAFLSFNNRGTGMVTDLIRTGKAGRDYARIGGCLERFEDCVIDVKAALDFMQGRGYRKVVLEGHSSGCQKITHYLSKTRDRRVRGLVELSPADDCEVSRKILGKRYDEAVGIARQMVSDGRAAEPVPEWMAFYPMLSARTFLGVADPKSASCRIFDYEGGLSELGAVSRPVFVALAGKDQYIPNPAQKAKILQNAFKDCEVSLYPNADHWLCGSEDRLARAIVGWVEKSAKN